MNVVPGHVIRFWNVCEQALEVDGGDSCTTIRRYLMPVSHLKMVKMANLMLHII